jgi:hypothetical protein
MISSRLLSVFFVGSLIASTSASAASCENKARDNAEITGCAIAAADRAMAEAGKHYQKALDIASRAMAECDLRVDFAPEIKESQRLWEQATKVECGLEGDVIMGTAGGVATAACMQKSAHERTKAMDGVFSTILGWCPEQPRSQPE